MLESYHSFITLNHVHDSGDEESYFIFSSKYTCKVGIWSYFDPSTSMLILTNRGKLYIVH